jgi:hypothetical protein
MKKEYFFFNFTQYELKNKKQFDELNEFVNIPFNEFLENNLYELFPIYWIPGFIILSIEYIGAKYRIHKFEKNNPQYFI